MDIKQLLAIDKVFFENTVPAAKSAGDEVWQQTQAAITYRTMIVDARLTGGIDISGNARLIDTLKQLVCLEAMADTVAERDLILTANGFGIVSNSNLAPASRERTEAFKASLDRSASARMDDAIEMLRAMEGWSETRPAHVLVSSAVFLARHLDFAGIARPHGETTGLQVEWRELHRECAVVGCSGVDGVAIAVVDDIHLHLFLACLATLGASAYHHRFAPCVHLLVGRHRCRERSAHIDFGRLRRVVGVYGFVDGAVGVGHGINIVASYAIGQPDLAGQHGMPSGLNGRLQIGVQGRR